MNFDNSKEQYDEIYSLNTKDIDNIICGEKRTILYYKVAFFIGRVI